MPALAAFDPNDPAASDRQLALLWGLAASFLLLFSPLALRLAAFLPACPFRTLTGFACPGCGTTRAALALAELEWGHAFSRFPLPAAFWVTFVAGGLLAGGLALAGRSFAFVPRRLPGWTKAALVAVVLGNWAYAIATGV